MTPLEKFASTVKKAVFYEADSDDKGARVSTNLENTPCPRCGATVAPNVVHLCGNRLPTLKSSGTAAIPLKRRKKAGAPTQKETGENLP